MLPNFPGGNCPANQVPQINPVNGVAQGCPDGGNCDPGYTCQVSTTNQRLCCGTGGINPGLGVCVNGGQPYISGVNGNPRTCNPGGFVGCPLGYSCQQTSIGVSVCCSDFARQAYCPANYAPSFVNNQVQYCYVTLPQSCTPPYQCLQAANGVGYVCCRQGGIFPNPCSNFQNPLMVNGQLEYCGSIGALCSTPGYTCQQSASGTQRVCCGGGNQYTCPGGRQALFLNTTPFTCSLAANNCPSGYTCEQATNGQFVCCGGGGSTNNFGTCPNGVAATRACTNVPNDPVCSSTETCQAVTGGDNFDGCCPGQGATPGTCPSNRNLVQSTSCASSFDCPSNSECVSTSNGVLGCCSSPLTDTACANGRLPDISNGQPRTCNPSAASCRQGYQCASAVSGGNICCQGPRCAGGVTIGSGPNGLPITCTIGGNDCPTNQRCENSANGQVVQICCPL